jgi:hypothetical protein
MSLLRRLFIRGESGNVAEVNDDKELLVNTGLNQPMYNNEELLQEILKELQEQTKMLKKIYQ